MSPSEEFVKQAALEHARELGCDCEPEITFSFAAGEIKGGVMNLSIAHDPTCALVTESK